MRALVLVLAVACALAGAALAVPTEAGITLHERVLTYAVTGSMAEELRASLDRLGPNGHDGHTDWYVRWQYSLERVSGGCVTTGAAVSVDATTKLPAWRPPAAASPSLVASWRRYVVALRWHEDGHRRNGIDAGRRILAGLRALAPSSTCSTERARADALGRRHLRAASRWDLDYDRRTRHGATQGAVFP